MWSLSHVGDSADKNSWFRRHRVVHVSRSTLVRITLPIILFCMSFIFLFARRGWWKIMLLFSSCHEEISHGSGHTGYGSLDQHTANWQVYTVHVLIVLFLSGSSGCEKSHLCSHLSFPGKQVWLRNPWLRFGHALQHYLQRWRGGARYWPSVTWKMKSIGIRIHEIDWNFFFKHRLLGDQYLHAGKKTVNLPPSLCQLICLLCVKVFISLLFHMCNPYRWIGR